jgi:alanine racemase
MQRFSADVDLGAIRSNVGRLRDAAGSAEVMAVVKADAYGHGVEPVARTVLAAGATWLGVAFVEEALALRAAGLDVPVLAMTASPRDDVTTAVEAGVDLAVHAVWGLEAAAEAARLANRPARVHLKVDTGLSRGGATAEDWPALVDATVAHVAESTVEVVGIWSHLACADTPAHPSVASQLEWFRSGLDVATRAGLTARVVHLANSAGTLAIPDARFDLVRPGIAVYGLTPGADLGTPASLGLRPAMTLRARIALVKEVDAGRGVSYGHRYTTDRRTRLALVPLGYADGIPRHGSGVGPVQIGGERYTVSGTVCMDQFVVDVGDAEVAAGDEVVLFGPGDDGEPTADEWAEAIGTIGYEIVTRIGGRVPRAYVGGAA